MQSNVNVLNSIRLNGSSLYQQRVPLATKNNVASISEAIFDPKNGGLFNEFAENLVNVIGNYIVRSYDWSNPLGELKRGYFAKGTRVEDIAVGLIKASGYDPTDNNVFARSIPNVYAAFHAINRKDRYDVTINRIELERAFNEENGLNALLLRALEVARISDAYDEFEIMKAVLLDNRSKIRNVNVNIADIAAAGNAEFKQLSRALRTYSKKLSIVPSGLYNFAGVPTVSKKEDLVFITTPEVSAGLDVEVLADAFNVDKAGLATRVIEIDELPDGVFGILVDKNWFVAGDFVSQLDFFNNPKSLETNFYLHRWAGYCWSPFGNAVVFSNGPSTTTGTVTVALTGINAAVVGDDGGSVTSVKSGETYHLVVTPEGDVTPETPVVIVPGEYTTTFISSDGVDLSARTRVDTKGKLFIESGLAVGTKITIHVRSAYVDPRTGKRSDYASDVVVTVGA